MMKIETTLLILLLGVSPTTYLAAQDVPSDVMMDEGMVDEMMDEGMVGEMMDEGMVGEMMQDEGIEFSIRFFDRRIYYPNSDIMLKMTIRNDSGAPYRFKLAEDRTFNLGFTVRTPLRNTLEPSPQFLRRRVASQQIFYREIVLEPGEEYAFTESLQEYVDIPGSGVYVVSGQFFPELSTSSVGALNSAERLTLPVRPSNARLDPVIARIETEAREILAREALSPDEVIEFTLRARQRGQWERFFLYVDVDSILRSDPARERRFVRLSEAEQLQEIEAFRNLLQSESTNEEISLIPDEFRILQTSYTPDQGEIVAELRFGGPDVTEIKEYTYFVRRRDRYWEIYDYSVQNIGVE